LLICVEALIFMVVNQYLFHVREYESIQEKEGPSYRVVEALLDASNPVDLVRAIGLAFGSFRARKSI
jgi:hypothetical protein